MFFREGQRPLFHLVHVEDAVEVITLMLGHNCWKAFQVVRNGIPCLVECLDMYGCGSRHESTQSRNGETAFK